MSSSIETLDLVHSYLTENRILGISRCVAYQNKAKLRMLHNRNPQILLAEITANGTKAQVDSLYLKRFSAGASSVAVIDLVDPQGLQQLEKVLHEVANNFNVFYEQLQLYKASIQHYVKFPTDACGEHIFKQD